LTAEREQSHFSATEKPLQLNCIGLAKGIRNKAWKARKKAGQIRFQVPTASERFDLSQLEHARPRNSKNFGQSGRPVLRDKFLPAKGPRAPIHRSHSLKLIRAYSTLFGLFDEKGQVSREASDPALRISGNAAQRRSSEVYPKNHSS
jgi:hypothetical protein